MISYIIKRILLMIPTFLVISLIIFLVLNLAPGDPAAQQAADGAETVSQDAQETYRIFKEQFNLDKPILFNTRYNLSVEAVEERLLILANFRRPICPDEDLAEVLEEEAERAEQEAEMGAALEATAEPDEPLLEEAEIARSDEDCTPVAERPRSGDIIDAQSTLGDYGHYAIPQLLEIAQTHERLDVRRLAANQLSTNARTPLLARSNPDPPPEIRERNRVISRQNTQIRQWRVPNDADSEAIETLLEENWLPWFEENRANYEFSATDKVRIFFLDTRFARYWENLLKLDLGISSQDRRPVLQTLKQKLPYTLTLSFFSIFLAYLISVPLGIWSAYNQNTKKDQVATVLLFVLYSLPSFFTAVLLIRFFTIGRPINWFPSGGFVGADPENLTALEFLGSVGWHIALPVLCLTYGSLAALSRYARTGILDVIRADYIRTARAKGLSESMVVIKHAVRNGMIPILTLLGTLLPALVSGSIVIEYIFDIPGIGLYLFESIFLRDYNAIMGCLLLSTVMTLVGLLISDISYAVVDPRITFD